MNIFDRQQVIFRIRGHRALKALLLALEYLLRHQHSVTISTADLSQMLSVSVRQLHVQLVAARRLGLVESTRKGRSAWTTYRICWASVCNLAQETNS